MATESVQFLAVEVSAGDPPPTPYTVPVGFLAVVTDISVVGAVSGRQLGIVDIYSTPAVFARLTFDSAENASAQWKGRVAVLAGDDIGANVHTNTTSVTIFVSGYLYS